jgi:hypothetical protein
MRNDAPCCTSKLISDSQHVRELVVPIRVCDIKADRYGTPIRRFEIKNVKGSPISSRESLAIGTMAGVMLIQPVALFAYPESIALCFHLNRALAGNCIRTRLVGCKHAVLDWRWCLRGLRLTRNEYQRDKQDRSHPDCAWLPNEKRLSCAAALCSSQMQFYYEGRRQLQPRVRLQRIRHFPNTARAKGPAHSQAGRVRRRRGSNRRW